MVSGKIRFFLKILRREDKLTAIPNFEKLSNEIGQKLWSIMPESAAQIIFRSTIHLKSESYGSSWIEQDGSLGQFDWDNEPEQVEKDIHDFVKQVQDLPIFSSTKWTHCKVVLNETGKVKLEFAYVDDEDWWPNLHMRGVSELTKLEAAQNYIPGKDWRKMSKAAISRKTLQIENALKEGDQNLVDALQTEIDEIKVRLES